jgi:hypothetical protein
MLKHTAGEQRKDPVKPMRSAVLKPGADIFHWIAGFKTRKRFQSAIGDHSPVDFETNLN